MKTVSKIAIGIVAAVGIGFAVISFAHGPGMGYGMGYGPGGGYGMGPHGGGYGMGMHAWGGGGYGPGMRGPAGFGGYGEASMETHLSTLKDELKLTEKQTKAWNAFEAAVNDQAKAMAGAYATMQPGQPDPEARIAFMEQRLAGMKAVQKARTDLYDVLTPEQKAVFDRPGPYGYRGNGG